jgi:hypothetical protein
MKASTLRTPAVLVAVLAAPLVALAQGGQKPAAPPPAAKPGPEHAILKMDAGTWDAAIEMAAQPGGKPITSTGVEVNTIGCGGLCLITDFKGTLAGTPFHGHGVTTWDAVKKRYVGSWTDSMSPGLGIGESTWDAAAKRMTGTMEGPDVTGKVTKVKTVSEYTPDGKRLFTLSAPGPDGKDMVVMKATYTRRK